MKATVEKLAKILHESGRQAVLERKLYRSDLHISPFCEWDDLNEDAKEGRRMMARHLLVSPELNIEVVEL